MEHSSEDDPIAADCDTAKDVVATPPHVKTSGEQPAHEDILAKAVRVILSPVGKRLKGKYSVGVLKKKKNVPKQYQLDDPCDDVEPYSPRSVIPAMTTYYSTAPAKQSLVN